MKAAYITWKSSLPKYLFKKGLEYRVMFEDIPNYVKKQWMKYADWLVGEEEKANPKFEMNAILNDDNSLENVYFQYYFDDYEYFDLKKKDEEECCKQFIEFVRENGEKLPDAYNPEIDELMGEVDWEILVYGG